MRRWRRFLFVLGALALLAACGARQQGPTAAAPSFNWRQFRGTTLRVLLSQSHWQQVIAPHLPEFEQLTGIKLAAEVYPQGALWDVLENGLKEPGWVDVFMTLPGLDGIRYLRAGGVQPVNDFLRDRTLTAPDYNWEDFFPRARAAMEIEGAILGPPVMAEHLALLYRKDVFKQYRVSVPRTLDELEAARIGVPGWAPPLVAVTAAREVVGQVIGAAIRGEDFRAAADVAAQRLVEILRTTEGLQSSPVPATLPSGRPGAS